MRDSLRSQLCTICSQFQADNSASTNTSTSTTTPADAASSNTNALSAVDIMSCTRNNPYTILAIEPEQLSTILNVPLEAVDNLRNQIANAIADNDSSIYTPSSITTAASITNPHTSTECASFLAGGFTLLQAHEQLQSQNSSCWSSSSRSQSVANNTSASTNTTTANISTAISTGSVALDRLLGSSTAARRKRNRSAATEDQTMGDPHHHAASASTASNTLLSEMGISYSKITQVSGPSPSGKTQLALTLAVNAINSNQHHCTVRYIASGGGSTGLVPLARRLRHIVMTLDKEGKIQIPRETILERVRFDCARDGYELLALLSQLEDEFCHFGVGNSNGSLNGNVLLVIDSISSCLAPLLYGEGDGGIGAALLNETHVALRRLSRLLRGTSRIAVFLTNGMVSDQKGGRKPALGEMWRAADVCIVLEAGRDISIQSEQNLQVDRVVVRSIRARIENGAVGGSSSNATNSDGGGDQTRNGERVEFGIGAPGIVDLDHQ
jgi:hypothetical protein